MAITYTQPDPKVVTPGEEIDDIFVVAATARKDFHKKRDELKNLVDTYYRQASASTYVSEDKIIECARECKSLKHEYRRICDILHPA